jgi:hypothetical protein
MCDPTAGWIRLYRCAADHPCLQSADALGVWCHLLTRAARREHEGRFRHRSVKLAIGQLAESVVKLAERLGLSHKRLRTILAMFEREGMVLVGKARGKPFSLITICKFSHFQDIELTGANPGAKPRANRTRKKDSEDSPPAYAGTPQGGLDAPGEGELVAASPPPEPPPVKPPEARRRAPDRGTRLSDDWKPGEKGIAFARNEGLTDEEIRRELAKFRNHFASASGRNARKCDWHATWRNWVLNALDRRGNGPTRLAAGAGGAAAGGGASRSCSDVRASREYLDEYAARQSYR